MNRRRIRTLILCGLMVLPAAAQDDSWKTEIDNSLVRASRRLVAPREAVSASEVPPALLVFLTDCSVRLTTAGRREELRGKRGQSLWHSGGRVGLENLGDQRMEIAQVVPKFKPDSSYQLPPANPRNVQFENDLIRMRRIGPLSATGLNLAAGKLQHPAPSVLIELSSAVHLRLKHTSGRVEEIQRKAGDIWFQPEDPFYPESIGDWPDHEALRIELKTREAKP